VQRPAPLSATPDSSNFLRPLLNVLRVRRWIILQALVLVPAVAVGWSLYQDPRYEASSQVLLSRTNLANVLSGTQDPSAQEFDFNRIIQTQANLARTPRVAQRTLDASKLATVTPDEFLAQSTVLTSPNTDILTLTVQDGDRDRAIILASNYAREFVGYKQDQTVNRLLGLQKDLTAEIDGLPVSSVLAQQDRAQLRRIRNLIALGDSSVSVVQTARHAEQVQPRLVSNVILGVIAGLVLGIGLAFFVDLLDTRLRRGEDVAERIGLPLLGRLPAPPKALRKRDRLMTLIGPETPEADAFRVLRTNLSFADIDATARSILVSSAVQSEGKSTTSANLAVALARAGRRVILLDLDLRRPYLHRFFDVARVPGATGVVLGDVALDEALTPIALDGAVPPTEELAAIAAGMGSLHLLAAGELPPNVGEFVSSAAIRNLLARLRERCDVLIVDTPPLLQVGDALALTAHVDAIIVVARLGVVRRQMVNEVRRRLEASPILPLGLVITDAKVDERSAGYGYYYYDDVPGGRSKRPEKAPPPVPEQTRSPV
jgi:capsular exopolysaccharide synthesis family protein